MRTAIQKRVIRSFALKFHELIAQDRENEIKRIIDSYNKKKYIDANNVTTVNNYFFIWIGTLSANSIDYIDIWRGNINDSDRIDVYYDSQFLLFNHYTTIFKIIYNINKSTSSYEILKSQDDIYVTMTRLLSLGFSFDDALLAIIKNSNKIYCNLKIQLKLARLKIHILKRTYNFVDISRIEDVFYSKFLQEMYYKELLLRGNAASAVDILRLCLLYKYGGIYVDVDTLPSLVPVYGDIDSTKFNPHIVNIVRSEYYLRRWREIKKLNRNKSIKLSPFENYLQKIDCKCIQKIKNKVCGATLDELSIPCPTVKVHRDLILLASFERYDEFNNNILAAYKKSKLIRIILKEISRRYKYIIKNSFDEADKFKNVSNEYLSRLSNYRYDTFDNKDNVTLFLTGPTLILEVVIGCAYEILKLPKYVSPLAISYTLGINCVSVAFCEHTNYTPEHVSSSWM